MFLKRCWNLYFSLFYHTTGKQKFLDVLLFTVQVLYEEILYLIHSHNLRITASFFLWILFISSHDFSKIIFQSNYCSHSLCHQFLFQYLIPSRTSNLLPTIFVSRYICCTNYIWNIDIEGTSFNCSFQSSTGSLLLDISNTFHVL